MDRKILDEVYKKIFDKKKDYLKTGFQELDECFLSGVEKGALITIGGRPSMGKTTFLLSVMINILNQNKFCLYFSLDENKENCLKRLITQIADIDNFKINNSQYLQETDILKIINAIDKIDSYNLEIYDENACFDNIKQTIENSKAEFIFIDSLQLTNLKTKKNKYEELSIIIKDLKQLPKEKNCIIFITSQLSRALEGRFDKRPMLSDLRDCGEIENISDVVLFVYRDEYYNQEDTFNKGKAELIVAKNKYGMVGSVNFLFNSRIPKYYNVVGNNVLE